MFYTLSFKKDSKMFLSNVHCLDKTLKSIFMQSKY